MKNYIIHATLLFIALSQAFSLQADCIATSGFWSDNELEHPFLCDSPEEARILVIPADVTVTIDAKINFDEAVFIIVRGVLFFDGNTSRLNMKAHSGVDIEQGGAIETNVKNNSQKLTIGGSTYWTSKMGEVPGPTTYGNEILPVELVSFEAYKEAAKIKLDWITASEENSDRFVIEHSTDARDFLAIGERTAAGFSNTKLNYDYEHSNPVSGINYYRLRQIDLDGAQELSDIRAVKFIQKDLFQIRQSNDFANIEVSFREGLRSKGSLRIFDLSGRLIDRYGLELSEESRSIDISNYEVGHYILQVESGGEQLVKPFVKMNV